MSQHVCNSTYQNRPVSVMLGWDRPLQEFFLTVEWADTDPEAEDTSSIFYASMYDNKRSIDRSSLDPIVAKLRDLGIDVPQSMFSEAETDRRLLTGNRYAVHTGAGFTG